MPLDGLRAWIGEVERKLGMRTRVFLVLTVIAIGGAGAGIYLAVDARNDSVSKSDVQALQQTLEARIGEGGGAAAGGAGTAQLEAELKALQAEVEKLSGEGAGAAPSKGGGEGGASGGGSGGASGSSGGKGGGHPSEGTSGEAEGGAATDGANSPKLHELLEQTKKQNEQAESEQGH